MKRELNFALLASLNLDDLAQPPCYHSPLRLAVLSELLQAIRTRKIQPEQPRVMVRFPKYFRNIIEFARQKVVPERLTATAREAVRKVTVDLVQSSVTF